MKKLFFTDELFFSKTSKLIKDLIIEISKTKENVVIGFPGGRSVSSLLNYLKNEQINWEKVHVFMTDERLVCINDDQSNFKLVKQGFSSVIPHENMHPFILKKDQLDYGINEYGKEIKKYGGSYDITLFSSGEDGHIGSLFPNHSSIEDESELYTLVKDAPKPPNMRMSVSKKFLLKSSIGILLFNGETKKKAYIKFLDTHVKVNECPAKLINNIPEAYVITNILLDNLENKL